jgi:hypothetical protein
MSAKDAPKKADTDGAGAKVMASIADGSASKNMAHVKAPAVGRSVVDEAKLQAGIKKADVSKLKHAETKGGMGDVKKAFSGQKKEFEDLVKRFTELSKKDPDDQLEYFLRSFIFDLGDDWRNVVKLQKEFQKRANESEPGKLDLNPVMAADFLQKSGRERTAQQRKDEVKDIDLDNNGRIAFIEYMLLHFKTMILEAYYKRQGIACPYDLKNGGVGICGVGYQLLDELFTIPAGLDPELEAAIAEFMKKKKERENKMKGLEATALAGGVRGLTATNELKQMEAADTTDMNRMEVTLNAAKRRAQAAGGGSADQALQARKRAEEEEAKKKKDESRAKLRAMAGKFEGKA